MPSSASSNHDDIPPHHREYDHQRYLRHQEVLPRATGVGDVSIHSSNGSSVMSCDDGVPVNRSAADDSAPGYARKIVGRTNHGPTRSLPKDYLLSPCEDHALGTSYKSKETTAVYHPLVDEDQVYKTEPLVITRDKVGKNLYVPSIISRSTSIDNALQVNLLHARSVNNVVGEEGIYPFAAQTVTGYSINGNVKTESTNKWEKTGKLSHTNNSISTSQCVNTSIPLSPRRMGSTFHLTDDPSSHSRGVTTFGPEPRTSQHSDSSSKQTEIACVRRISVIDTPIRLSPTSPLFESVGSGIYWSNELATAV